MSTISSVVITYNEENNIRECLESLKWTDEIIVVDSNSKDRTREIAKQYTDKIITTDILSFSVKRNMAFETASGEWIIWIDADEIITEELKQEIQNVIKSPENNGDSYLINRSSFFINRFIKHCGWYPDYTLRLFRKDAGIRFNNARVHEKMSYTGKPKKLKAEIVHYTDRDFEHYMRKMNTYTTSSALDLFDSRKTASLFDIFFRPVFAFIKMYFFKLGFMDGYTGLVLCSLSSTHVFMKYSKLYFMGK
jgi:glycosyltransferase involved in cell wall biosynthesis